MNHFSFSAFLGFTGNRRRNAKPRETPGQTIGDRTGRGGLKTEGGNPSGSWCEREEKPIVIPRTAGEGGVGIGRQRYLAVCPAKTGPLSQTSRGATEISAPGGHQGGDGLPSPKAKGRIRAPRRRRTRRETARLPTSVTVPSGPRSLAGQPGTEKMVCLDGAGTFGG